MSTRININGIIEKEAFVSVFDHGFLFGDSVYEVIATKNNLPCFLINHLKRLRNSAEGIDLNIPFDDQWFNSQINLTLLEAANEESYIRIVVTRGIGDIDIDPHSCHSPCVLILVTAARIYPMDFYANGIHLAVVNIKRNSKESLNPGIKTGNYLNNVLAKIEAGRLGANDALMLNPFGELTESTTSNIFFVLEGRIMTPSADCGILTGITRDIVMRIARENGFLLEEGRWPVEILEKSEEMFITGTIKKIMPVTRLNEKNIGDGKPGAITLGLMHLYDKFLEGVSS